MEFGELVDDEQQRLLPGRVRQDPEHVVPGAERRPDQVTVRAARQRVRPLRQVP
jgi:hypothetical protein